MRYLALCAVNEIDFRPTSAGSEPIAFPPLLVCHRRLHLVPGVGRIPLSKLTPAQLERWFREHQASGATPHAIAYARIVLRGALNKAKRWSAVVRNVATLVDAPRRTRKKIQPLTPEEARKLLAASADHRLGGLILIATAMGLRVGEALGLRWQDVDLDAGILRVRQCLERSGGDAAARRPLIVKRRELRKRIVAAPPRSAERREAWQELEALRVEWRKVRTTLNITEPKSTRSRRTIRMPGVVIAAVKAHRKRQLTERMAAGGGWQDTGLVFGTHFGSPLDSRNMTRTFKSLLQAAELPNVRFHDLRHTAATLLLAQGVDPRTIMETLGHSQISLTLNTYSHVLPALQAEGAAKLDAILTR